LKPDLHQPVDLQLGRLDCHRIIRRRFERNRSVNLLLSGFQFGLR